MPGNYIETIRKAWTVKVPRLAVCYRPLMNSIMAISILHMSFTEFEMLPPLKDPHTQRAKYLEATLQEHRQAIGSLDRTIVDAASITSLLLSLDALANLRGRLLQPYEAPTPWLMMCKGVMNVFRVGLGLLRDDETAIINQITSSSTNISDPASIFCEENRTRFPSLLIRRGNETDGDDEAYISTVSLIGAIVTANESGDEPIATTTRRVVAYPVLFPMRFVELVGQHVPRALAILAHYFAAARFSELSPWIGDTPRREILAISNFLPEEWQHLLAWPFEVLEQPTPPSLSPRALGLLSYNV